MRFTPLVLFLTASVSSAAVAQRAGHTPPAKQDTTKKDTTRKDTTKMGMQGMSMMKDSMKMGMHGMSMMNDSAKMGMHDMSMMMEHMAGAWKEMGAFHMLLAATYHPAEKDTLQPLRDKSGELATAARAWSSSTTPASCNTEEVKGNVARLSTDAQALDAQVKGNATDAALKQRLTELHTLFMSIAKACGDMKGMKH